MKSYSLYKAILRVIVVSGVLWGALFAAWWWKKWQHEKRIHDPRWTVRKIAARPLTSDTLPHCVLAEVLHLHTSSQVSLFAVQPKQVASSLLKCPAIESARSWRLLPGTLGIEYALRKPIAHIAGVHNVVIDRTKHVFWETPFYAPKRLPSLVCPVERVTTLEDLQQKITSLDEVSLGLDVLNILTPLARRTGLAVESIDVQRCKEQSIFRREIIVIFHPLSSKEEKVYVRLHPRDWSSKMAPLEKVLLTVAKSGLRQCCIDLRFGEFALVT